MRIIHKLYFVVAVNNLVTRETVFVCVVIVVCCKVVRADSKRYGIAPARLIYIRLGISEELYICH